MVFRSKSLYSGYIRCGDRYAYSILRDAAVAGKRVNLAAKGALLQFFDYRMFAAAAADDENIHICSVHQWWKSLNPVNAITMPCLLQQAMTSSSLTEPPGSAI